MNIPKFDSKQKISVVLPVRLTGSQVDLERLLLLNLRSLDAFLDKSSLSEVLIVANCGDIDRIKHAPSMQLNRLPVKFLDEDVVCPFFRRMGGLGWFRQQIIKIAIAQHVESEYILVIDDDCIMTRPAGVVDFLRDGKLLMSHIPIESLSSYFRSSCEVLKSPYGIYGCGEIIMNVTPEILLRDVLLGIQREIESLWGVACFGEWLLKVSREYNDRPSRSIFAPLRNRIFRSSRRRKAMALAELRAKCGEWSEYSLYWTYLKKHGLTNLYFDYAKDLTVPQIGDAGVWTDAEAGLLDIDDWVARTFGKDQSHYFAVVSAKITQLDWKLFIDRVSARLDLV
jgi:hypothetical protein